MSPRKAAPRSLEYVLLGFVEQEPIHGYDLYKAIHSIKGVSVIWHIKQSQLYSMLDKMESDGLLASTLIQGDAFPPRKQFQITDLGRQEFSTWRSTPVNHGREMRMEFLAKLYFAQKNQLETGIKLIDEQIEVCREWLAEQQQEFENLEDDYLFEGIVFQYRITQIEAMINWLDFCRNDIQRLHKSTLSPE